MLRPANAAQEGVSALDKMKIVKSTRHAKITGDFGETLVLYWLSKYGFECASVDHTGVDIIARNPHTQEIMGISVKSRSRREGKESELVNIPNGDFGKVEAACKAFGCEPYFAFVVDAGNMIRGFILPMNRLLKLFPKGKTVSAWKMTEAYLKRYERDPEIYSFELRTDTKRWWVQQVILTPSVRSRT